MVDFKKALKKLKEKEMQTDGSDYEPGIDDVLFDDLEDAFDKAPNTLPNSQPGGTYVAVIVAVERGRYGAEGDRYVKYIMDITEGEKKGGRLEKAATLEIGTAEKQFLVWAKKDLLILGHDLSGGLNKALSDERRATLVGTKVKVKLQFKKSKKTGEEHANLYFIKKLGMVSQTEMAENTASAAPADDDVPF